MKRTLSLRAERLTELTAADLLSVGGASGIPCDLQTGTCPSANCTGWYPSLNAPCTTE